MMSEDVFEKFMKFVMDESPNISSIDFSGWGEPLLDPGLFEKMAKIRNICSKITLGFVSNGTLIDDRVVDLINKTELDYIIISFDGASEKTYNKIRIGSNFNKVVEGLGNLSRKKHKNLSLSASFVVMKENINEMEKTVELFERLNFDSIYFKPLNVISTRDDIDFIANQDEILKHFDRIDQDKYSIKIALWGVGANGLEKNCSANAAGGAFFINCNGDVAPCCNIGHHVPAYVNHETGATAIDDCSYFLGNLNETALSEILNGAEYRKFLGKFHAGRIPAPCFGCQLIGSEMKN